MTDKPKLTLKMWNGKTTMGVHYTAEMVGTGFVSTMFTEKYTMDDFKSQIQEQFDKLGFQIEFIESNKEDKS